MLNALLSVQVWKLSGRYLGQHEGHTDAVTCLALDANFLFSGVFSFLLCKSALVFLLVEEALVSSRAFLFVTKQSCCCNLQGRKTAPSAYGTLLPPSTHRHPRHPQIILMLGVASVTVRNELMPWCLFHVASFYRVCINPKQSREVAVSLSLELLCPLAKPLS